MKLWLKVLLAGSLALNLAIAGLAAGAALRHKGSPPGKSGPPPSVGSLLFKDLDRETREALRSKAQDGHGSYRDRRRAETEIFLQLLRADPFDPTALEDMLKGQAQKREDFQSAVRQAWLARLAGMTAEERVEYAEQVERRMMRKHGSGRK
jgi:uncharacterized membrane protein